MESLTLTDPVVHPEQVTQTYQVRALTLNHDAVVLGADGPGLVGIDLRNNLGGTLYHQYAGAVALDFIRFINTGNFTTKSLHKRILEKLTNDGVLAGTVTGAPDPP